MQILPYKGIWVVYSYFNSAALRFLPYSHILMDI